MYHEMQLHILRNSCCLWLAWLQFSLVCQHSMFLLHSKKSSSIYTFRKIKHTYCCILHHLPYPEIGKKKNLRN